MTDPDSSVIESENRGVRSLALRIMHIRLSIGDILSRREVRGVRGAL